MTFHTDSTSSSSSHLSQYMSHLSPRSSSSISSLQDSSIATPSRFSVNSNLMNYSIPKNDNEHPLEIESKPTTVPTSRTMNDRRQIQQGSSDTRTRQLEAQIESLTLSNVRLQRSNRLLKVDTDNLIEQKTQPLQSTIRELTFNNVQLQRTTRLLQQDLEDKTEKLTQFQNDQVLSMKTVGPEYEYLVQMINLLHRQINGDANCEEICCYTSEPVDQSTVVMTLPPENEDQQNDENHGVEAQHICRPVIHSAISQGSYAAELERKISQLEQVIDELENEKETILRQQSYKDDDIQMLKNELKIKDDIVSQLEQDFMELEDKLEIMQKDLNCKDMNSIHRHHPHHHHHHSPSPPPDPKRQSQMLMESKRRSLAIKDPDLLEKMLRGDLDMDNLNDIVPPSPTSSSSSTLSDDYDGQEEHQDGKENHDNEINTIYETENKNSNIDSNKTDPLPTVVPRHHQVSSFLSNTTIPGRYPLSSSSSDDTAAIHGTALDSSPSPVIFAMMAVLQGCASQFGITDDWTLPLTITVMISGFLWSGGAKGVQLKVNLK